VPRSPGLIQVAAGVLRDARGCILITRRPPVGHAGGYWEFPGGKLQPGESPADALVRELREEIGVQVDSATPFLAYRHDYPERSVELHVFLVERYTGEPRGLEGQPLRWVSVADIPTAGLLEADLPIAEALSRSPVSRS